jgi:hypothetical protein
VAQETTVVHMEEKVHSDLAREQLLWRLELSWSDRIGAEK